MHLAKLHGAPRSDAGCVSGIGHRTQCSQSADPENLISLLPTVKTVSITISPTEKARLPLARVTSFGRNGAPAAEEPNEDSAA
jgi:hypothetical protein